VAIFSTNSYPYCVGNLRAVYRRVGMDSLFKMKILSPSVVKESRSSVLMPFSLERNNPIFLEPSLSRSYFFIEFRRRSFSEAKLGEHIWL
jgi:hypothetical protein